MADLDTLKSIEQSLLEAQGRHDSVGVVLNIVRSQIAEIEGRSSMNAADVAALQQTNIDLQSKVEALQSQLDDLKKKVK